MARFTELNERLLRLIVSSLKDDRPTLRALALTCPSLCKFASELLYHTVALNISDFKLDHPYPQRLLRVINQTDKRKDLQWMSHIHDLTVRWNVDQDVMRRREMVQFMNSVEGTRKLYLSSLYPSPRTPIIRTGPIFWDDDYKQSDPASWDVSRLSHLQELKLWLAISSADLARFLCLTPVETVLLEGRHQAQPKPSSSLAYLPRRQKPVLDLTLQTPYDYQSLHEILTAAASVKNLTIHEPGTLSADPATPCAGTYMPAMQTPYSPTHLTHALSPLLASLETLSIASLDTLVWPAGHDGTRLDLHGFQRLHSVAVDAKCFFAPYERRRPDICALLPPSLASLRIRFDPHTAAVRRTLPPVPPHSRLSQCRVYELEAYTDGVDDGWIVDVVRGACGGGGGDGPLLPALRRFCVEEEDYQGRR
ncbi:hypothetical protein SLS58_002894 [Diplodia intermedia]|uniref:F-box domain-containing protein n=1 Tax=Diplodia intermedia TaxID=856260 RepID=A0ABR3TYU0_9PEZI